MQVNRALGAFARLRGMQADANTAAGASALSLRQSA